MIRIEIKKQQKIFTGFFIKITLKNNQYKFLFTCNHSIPQQVIDSKIVISIYYGKQNEEIKKEIELDTNKRYIKTYEDLDATIIEIKKEDDIPPQKYLFPDLNYKIGLQHYQNAEVYTAGYPNVKIYRGDKHYSAGIIKKVNDNCFFEHNCDTKAGSSGCPILNYDKFVIGIHFGCDNGHKINYATFIGKIIDELFLEETNFNPSMNDYFIDEKEEPKFEKPNKEQIFLEKHKLDNDLEIKAAEILKNMNFEQLVTNIVNVPIFNDFSFFPNDNDTTNNIYFNALMKNIFKNMGFSENEQNKLMEIYKKKFNINKITNYISKNDSNPNEK